MLSDRGKSQLWFHGIVLIWGFTAVLGALITIDALPLVWFRMGIAALSIFVFVRFKGISLKAKRKQVLAMAFAGCVIALHWVTFFGAIKLANVSITLAMMSTGALFTSVLEPLFYKRKFIGYELFFGLLVILGLYLILQVETQYTTGILVALFSAFLASVFTLINGKFAQKYRPVVISFYELLAGFGCITLLLLVTQRFDITLFQIPAMDYVYLLVLGTICTGFAFIVAVRVMKHLSPYTVMLTTNLEPVYGILLAVFILGESEKMNLGFYCGAGLILITVIANGMLKRRQNPDKVPLSE
ncbi:MAG: DMT family transporter [Leeuwenhoekiella sp.]